MKERTTYEIIEPKSVGVPETRLVLGKAQRTACAGQTLRGSGHSADAGTAGVRCISVSRALADRKKGLRNDEIAALAREVVEDTKAPQASGS